MRKGELKMIKNSFIRGLNSFMYSVGIYLVLQVLITAITQAITGRGEFIPVIPEFTARFDSPHMAVYLQILLVGLTSAVFGAGSVIMELERLSYTFILYVLSPF